MVYKRKKSKQFYLQKNNEEVYEKLLYDLLELIAQGKRRGKRGLLSPKMGGENMDSKRKKGNYRLLILLSILLGIFFISTTAYARDGTLGYGESFSVKTKPGQWAWCGAQLYGNSSDKTYACIKDNRFYVLIYRKY